MRLFIAEKPSLGRAIADCLPGPQKKGTGYIETGGGTVTWCFGHILEAAEPGDYDPKWKAWPGSPSDLPIVPKTWKLAPVPKAKDQLKIIKDLLGGASEIVHAGDPDREGQLLVDEVLEYLGNRKPVRRIWLSSLDEKSVRQALEDLKPNDRFAPMKNAARARAQADWLVGMNLSRAYSISARSGGNPVAVLSVGRVQTPTLSLVVARDLEIEHFVPKDFFAVVARIEPGTSRAFDALWTPPDNHPALDSEKRCVDSSSAARIAERIKGQKGRLEVKKTDKADPPPLPFSLSTLTIEASKKYGLSAKDILDTAQSLYEKKLTTYPRTDCEYLPENQRGEVREILSALGRRTVYAVLAKDADPSLVSRAWNTEKVTAHHAIVPTREAGSSSSLSEKEEKIFDLVCRRYLAQFYPPFRYTETVATLQLAEEPFRATGKTPLSTGWKSVYQSVEENDGNEPEPTLPPLSSGDVVHCRDGTVKAKKTTPPKPYTDGTLIAAMKSVGKTLSDPGEKKNSSRHRRTGDGGHPGRRHRRTSLPGIHRKEQKNAGLDSQGTGPDRGRRFRGQEPGDDGPLGTPPGGDFERRESGRVSFRNRRSCRTAGRVRPEKNHLDSARRKALSGMRVGRPSPGEWKVRPVSRVFRISGLPAHGKDSRNGREEDKFQTKNG